MRIALPARCHLPDALTLKAACEQALSLDEPVELDGAAVAQIGTAMLQVLLALRLGVMSRGRMLSWSAASPALTAGADRLGLLRALGLPASVPAPDTHA